jgi:hypothetical protein
MPIIAFRENFFRGIDCSPKLFWRAIGGAPGQGNLD